MIPIIKCGSGYGFLAQGKEESFIITVANFLSDFQEGDYCWRVLGPIDGPQLVSADLIYKDRIAVLAATKAKHLTAETARFNKLVEQITPLPLARPPAPFRNDIAAAFQAFILELSGKTPVQVLCGESLRLLDNSASAVGLPVLDNGGAAIAVITNTKSLSAFLAKDAQNFLHDWQNRKLVESDNAVLISSLPDWLLAETNAGFQSLRITDLKRQQQLKDLKASRTLGISDGRVFWNQHGDQQLPEIMSNLTLSDFPKLAKAWILLHFKPGKVPLYDISGSAYLSGFIQGTIAADSERKGRIQAAIELAERPKMQIVGEDKGAKPTKKILNTKSVGF